jgi:hypothetical protein
MMGRVAETGQRRSSTSAGYGRLLPAENSAGRQLCFVLLGLARPPYATLCFRLSGIRLFRHVGKFVSQQMASALTAAKNEMVSNRVSLGVNRVCRFRGGGTRMYPDPTKIMPKSRLEKAPCIGIKRLAWRV